MPSATPSLSVAALRRRHAADHPGQHQRDQHHRQRATNAATQPAQQLAVGTADGDPRHPALHVGLDVQQDLGLPREHPEHDRRRHAVGLAGLGLAAAVQDAQHDQHGDQGRERPAGAGEPASRIRTRAVMRPPRTLRATWPAPAGAQARRPARPIGAPCAPAPRPTRNGDHRPPPIAPACATGPPSTTLDGAPAAADRASPVFAPGSRAVSPRWSLTSTDPPPSTTSAMIAGTWSRVCASRPSHGSSRTSRPGGTSSAWISPIFCALPLDRSAEPVRAERLAGQPFEPVLDGRSRTPRTAAMG